MLRAERRVSRKELADASASIRRPSATSSAGEYSPSLALAPRIGRSFHLSVEAVFSLGPLPALSRELYRRTP